MKEEYILRKCIYETCFFGVSAFFPLISSISRDCFMEEYYFDFIKKALEYL